MAEPWLKFYPQDWRADERLRNCGLSARGLWIEMLAIMHRSERYGYLLINGKQPTDAQIGVQAGAPSSDIPDLISELEAEGVFSRDRHGIIYSRRMIRDEKKAQHARKIGKSGGNPKLRKQTNNSAQDNPPLNQQDNGGDKPQIPEARSQSKRTVAKATSRKPALSYHRMPEGWQPSSPPPAPMQAKLSQWPPGAVEDEIAAFKRWAANAADQAGKGRKLDWDKALWNWLGREHDERYSRKSSSVSGLRGTRPNPALDLYRAACAEQDEEDHCGTRPALPAIGSG